MVLLLINTVIIIIIVIIVIIIIIIFLKILVFQKSPSLHKLIFKATELQKIFEYDNFPKKKLFLNLALGINLGINAVPVSSGQYLWQDFTFFH